MIEELFFQLLSKGESESVEFKTSFDKQTIETLTADPMTVLKKFELLKDESITHGCYLLFVGGESFISTIEMGRFATETVIKDSMTMGLPARSIAGDRGEYDRA